MTMTQPILSTVDFNLHGFVGIRLLDATAKEVKTITRQLGPIQAPLTTDPDITIRFVDQLPLTSGLRYLGVNDVGFTDDAFFILRGKHKTRALVQIPFAQIGGRCEIVCERGLAAVPLLIAIVNLTALNKGILPLHASAFNYNGSGILTTGWAKGGKTETLLSFMAHGATYIGDEWVYLSGDGDRMFGIPEPIRIWDWHLQELPQYWALVGRSDRTRLRSLRAVARTIEQITPSGKNGGSASAKLLKRIAHVLKQQLYVHIPPQKFAGQKFEPMVGHLNKIFFVASHETSDITVTPVDPQEIAERMVFSLQAERLDVLAYYLKFRFAFPQAHNELIEQAEERQRALLTKLLAGKASYAVYHPYPVSIPALFDVINPLL